MPLVNGAMAVVGDFNGDGKDDVAINLPGETAISVWYSRGDGTFYGVTELDPGQYPGAMAVGDFNGDVRQDLANRADFESPSVFVLQQRAGRVHAFILCFWRGHGCDGRF